MLGTPTLCDSCKHLRTGLASLDTRKCDAFPGGVPVDIAFLGHDHHDPVDGDHNIQYEKVDAEWADELLEAWEHRND